MSQSTVVIDSDDEESVFNEEDEQRLGEKILIRKKVPKLMGFVGIPFYMMTMYLLIIIFAVLHCALVLQATIQIKSGYIVTVFFGILGPISLFHWFISILFAFTGGIALFSRNRDYMQSAHQFRQWTRITRYFMLSIIVTSAQFMYGCYMFVHALSMKNIIARELEFRGVPQSSNKRFMLEELADWYDKLVYSNANSALVYPLNLLYSIGDHWGTYVPLAVILPWACIAYGHKAQIVYFNWKFYSSGLQID